ncbi:hypothetical protein ACQP2H_31755 (plasmid) [Micromonospora sp. CA-248260]|uniref:hypothetical protein n=1 Tax=Micromonospora sp. CA-248260 TaxID=3239962 RepID=UPI003D92A8CF
MSARIAELESEIRRLTRQRDAQPADTVYALTHQQRIDALSVELIAWQLDGAQMRAAEDAIRAAGRRHRRAHTGRSRWPAVAGGSGLLGSVATAGHLAANAGGPPVIGGVLLTAAAAALALTALDRVRDGREAAAAETDMHTAQHQYAAVVARHTRAITPVRPLAIHSQETPCAASSPQPPATSPSTAISTTPASAAATAGHPPAASRPSAPSSPTAAA